MFRIQSSFPSQVRTMGEIRQTPRHVAIIMDGNGRWARERGLPRAQGHRRGAQSVSDATKSCIERGVRYLTLYAFSSENWNRPKAEVAALMNLLDQFLRSKSDEIIERNIRLLAIGDLSKLPSATHKRLENLINRTAENQTLTLILALSYGGREDIVNAARSLAKDAASGKIIPAEIDERIFSANLSTAGIPDPDLLIRTSGEMRISNFLLWQISYSEIVIVSKNWPDFRQADFDAALAEYEKRHRRFGVL